MAEHFALVRGEIDLATAPDLLADIRRAMSDEHEVLCRPRPVAGPAAPDRRSSGCSGGAVA
jgi:hypothetical protein